LAQRFRQSRQTDGSDLTAGWLLIEACARGSADCIGTSDHESRATSRRGAPFRPRSSIPFSRLCPDAPRSRDDGEHEPSGKSVRQCHTKNAQHNLGTMG
jgi:hypothetical protein